MAGHPLGVRLLMNKEGAEHETNWKSGGGLRQASECAAHAAWDDDDAIRRIVHELNFGRYAAGRNGLHTAQQDCPAGRGKEKSA